MIFKLLIVDNNGNRVGYATGKYPERIDEEMRVIRNTKLYKEVVTKESYTQESICRKIRSLPPGVDLGIPKKYGDEADVWEFAKELMKDYDHKAWNYII